MKSKIENNQKLVEMSAKQMAELMMALNAFYKMKLKEKHGKQK